jgi:SAM-dependent methyltransferase
LSVDEWDRFHGLTGAKIPFVFSRHAQIEFFDLLDGFDDESITVKGKRYEVGPWLLPNDDTNKAQYWSDAYVKGDTRFDQGGEAAFLPVVLPQLKLSKSRILVMGSGFGHDAAYLAQQGHSVTGIDFSTEAIAHSKTKYGSIENLSFLQKDVFNLPPEWTSRFDMIFEHTCYCAVAPDRRNELVGVWKRLLNPSGYLLGAFFVHERRLGPPWGGSEWELRERLRKPFEFMFWTRWRQSPARRRGKELVMYARKRG